MTESDIDFEHKLINIDHQLLKVSGIGYHVETPKTKSGIRQILMSTKVYEAFKRVLNGRGRADKLIVGGYSNFLFLNRNGLPKVAINYDTMLGIISTVSSCAISSISRSFFYLPVFISRFSTGPATLWNIHSGRAQQLPYLAAGAEPAAFAAGISASPVDPKASCQRPYPALQRESTP